MSRSSSAADGEEGENTQERQAFPLSEGDDGGDSGKGTSDAARGKSRRSRLSPFVGPQLQQQPPSQQPYQQFLGVGSRSSVEGPWTDSSPSPFFSEPVFYSSSSNSNTSNYAAKAPFVSHYSQLYSSPDLRSYLQRKGLVFSEDAEKFVVTFCPFCPPHKNKRDNLNKLIFFRNSGNFYCHRCGSKGSLFDFKMRTGDLSSSSGGSGAEGMFLPQQRQQQAMMLTLPAPLFDGGQCENTNVPGVHPHREQHQPQLDVYAKNLAAVATVAAAEGGNSGNRANSEDCHRRVLRYLTEKRGLKVETLLEFGVGSGVFFFPPASGEGPSEPHCCVTFPWMPAVHCRAPGAGEASSRRGLKGVASGQTKPMPVRLKVRSIEDKSCMRLEPCRASGKWGLFGADVVLRQLWRSSTGSTSSSNKKAHADASQPVAAAAEVPPEDEAGAAAAGRHQQEQQQQQQQEQQQQQQLYSGDAICIAEGEFDAMAIWQQTGMPTVSVPVGANSLPPYLLPFFERFKSIYLWFDEDSAGREGADLWASKLGISRCHVVRHTDEILEHLRQRLQTPGKALAEDKTEEDEEEEMRIPKDANECLLAGLDLRTLLCSARRVPHQQILTFQDLRSRVMHELVEPAATRGLQSATLPAFTAILGGFRRGELSIWTGGTGAGKTTALSQLSLDFCSQGVPTLWGSFEVNNIRLLRMMMLQFSDGVAGASRKDFSRVADSFAQLPLWLLRFHGSTSVEEDDHVPLGLSSVFGSVKSTQEADNVVILQREASRTSHQSRHEQQLPQGLQQHLQRGGPNRHKQRRMHYALEIRKNRFSGELGSVPYVFDPTSLLMRAVEGARAGESAFGAEDAHEMHRGEAAAAAESAAQEGRRLDFGLRSSARDAVAFKGVHEPKSLMSLFAPRGFPLNSMASAAAPPRSTQRLWLSEERPRAGHPIAAAHSPPPPAPCADLAAAAEGLVPVEATTPSKFEASRGATTHPEPDGDNRLSNRTAAPADAAKKAPKAIELSGELPIAVLREIAAALPLQPPIKTAGAGRTKALLLEDLQAAAHSSPKIKACIDSMLQQHERLLQRQQQQQQHQQQLLLTAAGQVDLEVAPQSQNQSADPTAAGAVFAGNLSQGLTGAPPHVTLTQKIPLSHYLEQRNSSYAKAARLDLEALRKRSDASAAERGDCPAAAPEESALPPAACTGSPEKPLNSSENAKERTPDAAASPREGASGESASSDSSASSSEEVVFVQVPLHVQDERLSSDFVLIDSPSKARRVEVLLRKLLEFLQQEASSKKHQQQGQSPSLPQQELKQQPELQQRLNPEWQPEAGGYRQPEGLIAMGLDVETTGLDPHSSSLRLVQVALPELPCLVYDVAKLPPASLEGLLLLLQTPLITKVMHHAKFDLSFLSQFLLKLRQQQHQQQEEETQHQQGESGTSGSASFARRSAEYTLAASEELGGLSPPFFDTLLASRLLEAGQIHSGFSLAQVTERALGVFLDKQMQVSDWKLPELSDEQLLYAARDAAVLLPLHDRLSRRLQQHQLLRVADLEHRTLPAVRKVLPASLASSAASGCANAESAAVVSMERTGMALDMTCWNGLAERLRKEQEEAANALLEQLGETAETINLNSQRQILEALRRVGVSHAPSTRQRPPAAKADAGAAAADASTTNPFVLTDTGDNTLSRLSHFPAVAALRNFRRASKAVSAFAERLPRHVNPTTGRIHAQLHQCGAGSGRFSCDSPNLQQIPREAAFRRCFVPAAHRLLLNLPAVPAAGAADEARADDAAQKFSSDEAADAAAALKPPAAPTDAAHQEKWKFLIADFSQIELRIAADIAQDEKMIEAYQKGQDLHRLTASLLLSKPEDKLSKADRQLAKAVNFGLIYGISVPRFREYALSAYGVSLTPAEARAFHANFFKHFRGITRWHQQQKRLMPLETRTRSGRRASFDDFSFTKALNYPVQGTSADITKESLALLLPRLREVEGQLVMCVHDEIIVQVPERHQERGLEILLHTMKEAGSLFLRRVPCEAEGKIGDSWADKP
ncbi:uncharacterized protein LOC34619093 [Cyclospora cayetanensis]|uniref:Uncharacterized protein LOC34619093 n=1 Tax=Cyclospora cayetanensis TaxID=88456 RepID=A0A6P6S3A4_9EIME|nr:uncharacterized protein LOC34619093 [Cyclospora cayetanensis]